MHTAIQVKLSEPFTQHSQLFLITKSISAWLMCQQISYHHAATTTTTITTSSTTTREYKAHAKKRRVETFLWDSVVCFLGRIFWLGRLAPVVGRGRRTAAKKEAKRGGDYIDSDCLLASSASPSSLLLLFFFLFFFLLLPFSSPEAATGAPFLLFPLK